MDLRDERSDEALQVFHISWSKRIHTGATLYLGEQRFSQMLGRLFPFSAPRVKEPEHF